MENKRRISKTVDAKSDEFASLADQIWEAAETRFNLKKSADVLCTYLSKEGFEITRGVADMDDAFVASFGSGGPVVGILAEYDALESLSQVADLPQRKPNISGGKGHGCGHHGLGAGAVAGAVGVKQILEEGSLPGTVKLFGCPAEESGYGKAFMARAGVFRDVDAVVTWHPGDAHSIWMSESLAVYQLYFSFKGRAAHAAAAPEQGRSALDAAELMNIGVNFLREHMISSARIHYAFMDVGGQSANVVQPTAALYYFIRAPKRNQVQPLYERVVKIAQGAALMTETELEVKWDSACLNYLPNKELSKAMFLNAKCVLPIGFTDPETQYAQQFCDTLDETSKQALLARTKMTYPKETVECIQEIASMPLNDLPVTMMVSDQAMPGSTDVGDVSWVAPTAQISVACYPQGIPPHSWQLVATGKSSVFHKGIAAAGKILAMTALDVFENPALLEEAKKEHKATLGGEVYESPIPPEVKPH